MDDNKLKVLQDLPYRLRDVCSECKHGDFERGVDFGYCCDTTYDHLKHTGIHFLSIHRTGHCPKFQREAEHHLGAFAQFIETS